MNIAPHYIHCSGPPVDVLFFGEGPGAEEIKQGRAFVGPSGEIMGSLIGKELSGQRVCLDNVYPEDSLGAGVKPRKKDLLEFYEYVQERIKTHHPKVIVALGNVALQGLGVERPKITQLCGRVVEGDTNGVLLIASIHPAFALRDSKQLDRFRGVFAAVRLNLREQTKTPGIHRVDDPVQWKFLLPKDKLCAFDIETSSLDPSKGRLLTAAVSWINAKHRPYTMWTSFYHKDYDRFGDEKLKALLDWWPKGPRVCHNAKFELRWMHALGSTQDPTVLHDTMMQAWLLDENEPHGLDHLAIKYLKVPPWWLEMPTSGSYADADLDTLGVYNAHDALYTLNIHKHQRLRMGPDLQLLADKHLNPLVKVLAKMEERGLYCGEGPLAKVCSRMKGVKSRLVKKIHTIWPDLNIRSHPQVRKLCFTDLRLTPVRYTKGGKSKRRLASTDADSLEALGQIEPRLKPLAELRSAESLLSRVLEPWVRDLVDENHLIHTSYGTTVTGRLTSYDPNMQNIDRRGESYKWKGCQRDALVSRYPGGKIIQADYSQHELRTYAAVAGDEFFLKVFKNPKADVHTETAGELKIERTIAKNVNFSILYVITPEGLREKYGIEYETGKATIAAWHKKHPWLKHLYLKACEDLLQQGYVENIFGWRRRLENLEASKPAIQNFLRALKGGSEEFYYECSHEIRAVINFLIQGPAALITNWALMEVEKSCGSGKYDSLVVHQIHDSIVVDSRSGRANAVAKQVVKIMEKLDLTPYTGHRLRNRIPLKAEVKIGSSL